MTAGPEWMTPDDVLFIHREVIASFGGSDGVRDQGLLESAVHRARDQFAYGSPDLCELAAAYAYGLAKNHPFVDGNKRVAFVVARVFLGINSVDVNPPEPETVVMVEGLAAGGVSQAEFASWLRKHSK